MKSQSRIINIILAYPFVILSAAVPVNIFLFGINPYVVALPSIEVISALVLSTVLLIANHAWLMTSTELTRVRFKMYATPEEWAAAGRKAVNASEEGVRELKRHHDTHQNTTENLVYFILLAFLIALASPPVTLAQVWLIGFAIARIGYSYSFLSGKDNARGLFMTLSLLAMFGMASYLAMSLLV